MAIVTVLLEVLMEMLMVINYTMIVKLEIIVN